MYNYNCIMGFPKIDLSELVIKLKLETRTTLEYYNARIAFWERLLFEESHLQMKLEWQKEMIDLIVMEIYLLFWLMVSI